MSPPQRSRGEWHGPHILMSDYEPCARRRDNRSLQQRPMAKGSRGFLLPNVRYRWNLTCSFPFLASQRRWPKPQLSGWSTSAKGSVGAAGNQVILDPGVRPTLLGRCLFLPEEMQNTWTREKTRLATDSPRAVSGPTTNGKD